jgi:hypothetical protein
MLMSRMTWCLVRKVTLVRERPRCAQGEPSGQQRDRARVSALVSAKLARRARRCGVPVVPARPWSDGLDRVEAALRET